MNNIENIDTKKCTADGNRADKRKNKWNIIIVAILISPILIFAAINTTDAHRAQGPGSVINLTNNSYADTYINWTWKDPGNNNGLFNVSIYLNGQYMTDVLMGVQYYNATNLNPNSQYTVSTRTVNRRGTSQEWINDTESTSPTPIITPTDISAIIPTDTPALAPTNIPAIIPNWNLIWNDEFNGNSIDTNKWDLFAGSADGDTCFMPNAVTVSNGLAHLAIIRQDTTCVDYGNGNGKGTTVNHHYAGGGIGNYGPPNGNILTSGRWETRARFPQGVGTTAYIALWPANGIWTAEIDFAEALGSNTAQMTFTQHWNGNVADQTEETVLNSIDITKFHTYAVEMGNGQLKWYVDDILVATQTQHFSATTQMGFTAGAWAGVCPSSWTGCPDSTVLPVYLDIDYVRVYEHT